MIVLWLNTSHFQTFGQKSGSSDISKWCSEVKIWPFSDVQKKMSTWAYKNGFSSEKNKMIDSSSTMHYNIFSRFFVQQ